MTEAQMRQYGRITQDNEFYGVVPDVKKKKRAAVLQQEQARKRAVL